MRVSRLLILLFTGIVAQAVGQHTDDQYRVLRKGIYRSFYEYLTNSPGRVDSYRVDSIPRPGYRWNGTYTRMLVNSVDGSEITDIWGFCDGINAYIFYQEDFFPIEYDDDYPAFFGYGLPDNKQVDDAIIMGGLVGASVALNSARHAARNNKHKYYIDPGSGKVFESKFGLTYYVPPVKNTKLVFYRKDDEEADKPFNFLIDDTLMLSFIPNAYKEFILTHSIKPIRLRYGKDFSEHFEVYTDPEKTTYIQCSHKNSEGVIKMEKVKASVGEFESNKARRIQKKRDRKMDKQGG